MRRLAPSVLLVASLFPDYSSVAQDGAKPLKILFLGDRGHHRPAQRFAQLQPVLARRGIELTYTEKMSTLSKDGLAPYAGLAIYANIGKITPEQEKALLEFVEGGKGLIPIHCASYCFLNSPKYIALVGAQFRRHGGGTFRTTIVRSDHPIMQGFHGFESWDETYVHAKHNEKDRIVLSHRDEKGRPEPWTWVRTQGKGRVFYTAWGHDKRTWGQPGFQNLIERGIRWAIGGDPSVVPAFGRAPSRKAFPLPEITPPREDVAPFEFVDVGKKIPNYPRARRWGVQGELLSKMQSPIAAAESIKHIRVPLGFHVELFASEPELHGKPIAMSWDERGRLWVSETHDYPNELQPPGKGRDTIRICEDTDGDGRADKFTVFADKLSIATSIFFSRGGVIVFDGTRTVFLEDTNGDDVADERKVLFEGWNQRDTHGGPSNLQYGLDNQIWAMQGYNFSRLTVGGEKHGFRQGFFRFHADGSKLEFIRSTDNNCWGVGMTEEGIVFGSTANRNPSVYMPIPNRYYEAVRGWRASLRLGTIADTHLFEPVTERVRQVDQHGGYTAGSGHAIYTARNYPQEYWNRAAFVCGPTGHLVGTFVLEADGSDFRSTNPFNLFASDDAWTAPIIAEVGPDGNVWVSDWYNYIVQHNPTPRGFKTGKGAAYETDLRDKRRGRIYRVIWGDKKGLPDRFSLAGASPQKLVETLGHDNLFWRRHAQRLLVERGKRDVLAPLYALVKRSQIDAIGLDVGAIHALWTIHGLGALDGSTPEATSVAYAALRHKSAGVRRNAVQVLPRNVESVKALVGAKLVRDPDAQVRLMTLIAIADLPASPDALPAITEAFRNPAHARDRWISDALTCAAAKNSEQFLRGIASMKSASESALSAISIVAEHFARGSAESSVASFPAIVEGLANADGSIADAVVDGIARGWPANAPPKIDAPLEEKLLRLAERLPAESRAPLVQLAGSWGSEKLEKFAKDAVESLATKVADATAGAGDRVDAARELVAYRSKDVEVAGSLLDLITPQLSSEIASGVVRALELSTSDGTGKVIADRLVGLTPAVRNAAISVLLSRESWARMLLERAKQKKFRLHELSLEQRTRLTSHQDGNIRWRTRELLRQDGSLPNPDRQEVIEELLPIAEEKGNVTAGVEVFKKACANCHIHGELGQRIGPELTGMATHSPVEMLTSILDPNRSVEGNFRVYTVVTSKGLALNGLLASESKTAIELIDAEAKKRTVLREDIVKLDATTRSLMPEGFEKQLKREELRDLLAFLSQRGKYLPMSIASIATAVSTQGMFGTPESRDGRLVFDDWKPKTVEGVPFQLVDPRGGKVKNVILLHGPQGRLPPKMPRWVELECNSPIQAIHILGGVSGQGHPHGQKGSVSVTVRVRYKDGVYEDHVLQNGVHFADYSRRVDVPGSKFAFDLGGRQVRCLSVPVKRDVPVERLDFVKGRDGTAPIMMAVTLEMRGE